jgi:hypothetical protein
VRRLISLLAPALMAGWFFAAPAPVAASGGMIEIGTTTYTVNTAASRIDVSIQLQITNNKPPSGGYVYFVDKTQVAVEAQAGTVRASANEATVSQSVIKTDRWYRYLLLSFNPVWYGTTRVITLRYSIDGKPRAEGDYRAVKAFTNLCAVGNGYDSGTVNVVIPSGFDVNVYAGQNLQQAGTAGGTQTYTSGKLSQPYKFWTCMEGSNPDALVTSQLTVAGQKFEIQSWPEDPDWKTMIEGELDEDITALLDMNGLDLPGGTVGVREVGNSELGEYAGMYNSGSKIAYLTEQTGPDIVAHELSHIWYNHNLFQDKWALEGMAGYSEQLAGPGLYTPCTEPGTYPGTGSPDLSHWVMLGMDSTTQDEEVLDYEYSAACYIFTELVGDMGADNFKAVLMAGANGEMAYQGGTPREKVTASEIPLSAEAVLDLIDERGMIPAGIEDLDRAQDLLARYGIFGASVLDDRSEARAAYHELEDELGGWDMPLVVRSPMTSWSFVEAGEAMDGTSQILDNRDEMESRLSDVDFDGTELQTLFEETTTSRELTDLLDKTNLDLQASEVLAEARAAESAGHDPLATIGLLGVDLKPSLDEATVAIKDVRPDDARAAAQGVLDQIDGATVAGLLRVAVVLGVLVALFLALMLVRWLRKRCRVVPAMAVAGEGMSSGEASPDAGEATGASPAAEPPAAEAPAAAEPPAAEAPPKPPSAETPG